MRRQTYAYQWKVTGQLIGKYRGQFSYGKLITGRFSDSGLVKLIGTMVYEGFLPMVKASNIENMKF
jgi:hypothetical protein